MARKNKKCTMRKRKRKRKSNKRNTGVKSVLLKTLTFEII